MVLPASVRHLIGSGRLGHLARFALLLGLLCSTANAAAQSDPDFAIPSGRFFTEALPGQAGIGFAVQDGQGASMWSAFQAAGGVETLGYPISRRFDLFGSPAQAFQYGILRFDSATGEAERLSVDLLPNRRLPLQAIQPDYPPRAEAQIEPKPWSGWWWPASDGHGPTLFQPGGPLDKYDRYLGLASGDAPATREWERTHVYFSDVNWAGHCNGFAAAALLEPEPTQSVEVLGITFTVADLKGLLVDYHFGDAAAWSFGDEQEVNPATFHHMLLDWVGTAGKGFVLTFEPTDGEVWSYPVYRFESEWSPDSDEPDTWHVKTIVWMADMDVAPNFVGTSPFPGLSGQIFEYTLWGDPREPSDGSGSRPAPGRCCPPRR
jgi:transglutaminase elicitor